MTELSTDLGVSERQLHRRFVEAVEYGPKVFARIMRLHRLLAIAGQRSPDTMTRSRVLITAVADGMGGSRFRPRRVERRAEVDLAQPRECRKSATSAASMSGSS